MTDDGSGTDHRRDTVGSCILTIPVILPGNNGRPGRTVARALLSREEARDALGIGDSTLYGLMRSGRLRFLRLGGRTMFAAGDLGAYIDQERGERNPPMRSTPWANDRGAVERRTATRTARHP
jgi:excisionase family DNA binding protein